MFCPECGFDAEETKVCPECGTGLDTFRSSMDVDVDDAPRRARREEDWWLSTRPWSTTASNGAGQPRVPWAEAAGEAVTPVPGRHLGEPGVGSDYATSLFQSGDTASALKQVDLVVAKTPDYQNARLSKGIHLQTASRAAQRNGQQAKAASLLAQAKAELQKAVDIDPASSGGKKVAENLKSF